MPPALDKKSQLAQQSTAARKKLLLATRRLDPRFPYAILAFDPDFFQIPADPDPNPVNPVNPV